MVSDRSSDQVQRSSRFIRFLKGWDLQKLKAKDPKEEVPRSLSGLNPQSISALHRLVCHRPEVDQFPTKRRAAVMIGLFASRQGHLNVLLTRRSSTMRTYVLHISLSFF
ncbi:hypothetical protein BY996DRAFT_7598944 [Phakopsora pachyrhizi]|nr:hypothetical protein BY996DRAFT_7598944 [Phakopsora pachyrhizi]